MTQLSKNANSILALVITCIAAATFSGCDSPSQKVDNAKDNVTVAKENLIQAQEDYKTEVVNFKNETNEKLTANEKAFADFKIQMETAKKDVKATYEKQIAALEQKNSDMKKRMNEYSEDGKDNWQSFKREFDHDMDELGQSLKDFTVNNKK
ncbi:MAG: hypothetical protein IPJ09_21445 [Saprospiraceae bacterium]|nr:hypothetical protein [Saprospiraceae bacterium]